jgi:hypothetical protein
MMHVWSSDARVAGVADLSAVARRAKAEGEAGGCLKIEFNVVPAKAGTHTPCHQ